eukprot:839451-Pelagomonas_calceolata.AAC.3
MVIPTAGPPYIWPTAIPGPTSPYIPLCACSEQLKHVYRSQVMSKAENLTGGGALCGTEAVCTQFGRRRWNF